MQGKFVVHPSGIVHGKWPKVNVRSVRPVEGGMGHVGMGHIGDCLYDMFGNSILVVSANTTEIKSLAKAMAVGVKLRTSKNTIIRMVVFDTNTHISSLMLKKQFATNCVAGSGGELVVHENERAAMVHINSSAGVSMLGGAVA